MKNRTTLEDVIEEVCLRTDSEDDSTFPVVTIGKDKKKEETYSDYFQSLPLVESSNTTSEMDVNEVRSHPMFYKTKCFQVVKRDKSKAQNKGDMKQLFQLI